MATSIKNDHIRYEPEDPCPVFLWSFAGIQGVLLVLTPTVTTTALVAGQSEQYLIWVAFAALLICGFTTALQASVSLIVAGGPAMLAGLTIAVAMAQFALPTQLWLLRRIVTPMVSGTALPLMATTVIPIAAGRLTAVPDGPTSYSGLVVGQSRPRFRPHPAAAWNRPAHATAPPGTPL